MHAGGQSNAGLYDPLASHSNCGVGVLVDIQGRAQHRIVEDGLRVLLNLDHRGARGAEETTGDGAGILLQKPHLFFRSEIPALGEFDEYGVGQIFLPQPKTLRTGIIRCIEEVTNQENMVVHAWRAVPTDHTGLGQTALASEPCVMQVFIKARGNISEQELDSRLYVLRRMIEKAVDKLQNPDNSPFYICSLDRRKIVYKGLLTAAQLRDYYPDLSDVRVESSLALVHSRFSTNTLGAWELAHPYRCSVHNGEINTLRGNLNAMKTREHDFACLRYGEDIAKIIPVTCEGQSDTAILDNVIELLTESGRSLPHTLRMLIPEAWHKDSFMDAGRRAFYEYHAMLMEPWDGPALVAASDGYRVAAILDRNGLRPCRYYVTRNDLLVMASETGVLDVPEDEIVYKGRLRPGQLLVADTIQKRILGATEIFEQLAKPCYQQWLADRRTKLHDLLTGQELLEPFPASCRIEQAQRVFDYTLENLNHLVKPMSESGKDPIGSMGSDTPLAVLSGRYKSLFQYFSQLFAQVSNPPLDYIREELVTTLECPVGRKHNLLSESPEHCRQLILDSPVLTDRELMALRQLDSHKIRSCTVTMTFPVKMKLREGIRLLQTRTELAIRSGYEIIILTDRDTAAEVLPIPALLAIGAVHHELIRKGLRNRAGLVLDTAHSSLVHHYCTLLGFGADAIHPWLACQTIADMVQKGLINKKCSIALKQYRHAVEDGILKVMSKMGISTLESYKGAQVFEVTGLDYDLINEYFEGTAAHLPGIGIEEIENELREKHRDAFAHKLPGNLDLEQGGELYWRRDGEVHHWNPDTIGLLQRAVKSSNYKIYREFAAYSNQQDEHLHTLRGVLDFKYEATLTIDIDDVESCESIVKRFSTGSMSFGALSQEAHETLAIAMNRIHGKSGSGEGGEQAARFGTERQCSMKQVASGRFGVTIEYLSHARQIEIKMAQGSKPGEGGELPGAKVDENIAAVRFTTPGVGLISPPPHHDIYSIEDLAQLIHDLKCANADAEIHVKLVAETGVGTIAAGVAKARADAVLISGDAGGTGASVKTSIQSAGSSWELGLAETQQVLLANNLRSRIRVRVDGGLRTGRDVVVAALLGAEEYGFGTAPLVALGCVMLRKCHCNTCSVGIATQDPDLRKRFAGKPEYVMNYMMFVAEEVRELMARLGFRSMDEMIGRVDMLRQKSCNLPKDTKLDMSQLLYKQPSNDALHKTRQQNHKLDEQLDIFLIEKSRVALESRKPVSIHVEIHNRDRSVGVMLSSAVVKRYGASGLSADTIRIYCTGNAGQSYGAFLASGISLYLEGDANDYVGKGLSGGKICIRTPTRAVFVASENVIIGNVALYGATGGELYVNGIAGERFCVRNSGAMAVVEGTGDHGCEYMTGGVVLIIGKTGRNFGAGMSGGEAFILDEDGHFTDRLNHEVVHTECCDHESDYRMIYRMLENHYLYTNSIKARSILDDWNMQKNNFIKVLPDACDQIIEQKNLKGNGIEFIPPPGPGNHMAGHTII